MPIPASAAQTTSKMVGMGENVARRNPDKNIRAPRWSFTPALARETTVLSMSAQTATRMPDYAWITIGSVIKRFNMVATRVMMIKDGVTIPRVPQIPPQIPACS